MDANRRWMLVTLLQTDVPSIQACRWQKVVGRFKRTAKASVPERLTRRQSSEGEDAIDTQVIELLQDRHA